MAEKPGKRTVQIEYQYDRLATEKLAQVYRLLVFDHVQFCNKTSTITLENGDTLNENRGHLCASIVGQTKRRTDDL
jgi:hypothetical protein